MTLSLFLLLLGQLPPGVQQQQNIGALENRINQVQSDVQRMSSELKSTQQLVQDQLRPMCSAEVRLQPQPASLKITDPQAPIRANVFSIVSTPSDACLPAEISVTATYFDPMEMFVCSGTIVIGQGVRVQNTLFEFRPYEVEVFAKWWDGQTLRQQTLNCADARGNDLRNPADYSASLRLFVTAFPKRGGLSTSEVQVNLPRFTRR